MTPLAARVLAPLPISAGAGAPAGGLIIGDGANLFNGQKIKGIDLAMRSGMPATQMLRSRTSSRPACVWGEARWLKGPAILYRGFLGELLPCGV
jgi:flavin-dependent dehydrogenase